MDVEIFLEAVRAQFSTTYIYIAYIYTSFELLLCNFIFVESFLYFYPNYVEVRPLRGTKEAAFLEMTAA